VAVDFQVGDRSSLHCTSIGKALLAYQEPEFVRTVIDDGLVRRTANTIVDGSRLEQELESVRSQGYAIDDHELYDNMRCIAAPVFERDSRVRMGISCSGPASRFSLAYPRRLREPLLEASRELTACLGGSARAES
jgi:IclR family acetate operon transcriptional repressor